MGDLLRSEKMVLCHMFIPTEASYFVISELGEVGIVQFRDLNPRVNYYQRNFVKEIQMCYTMEQRLKYITEQVKESKIKIFKLPETAKARLTPNEISSLKMQIKHAEIEIRRLTQNARDLKTYSTQLGEFKCVLQKNEDFMKKRDEVFGLDTGYRTSLHFMTTPGLDQLHIITGVVNKDRAAAFERTIWRMSKGQVFFRKDDMNEPIMDYTTGNKQYKTVFCACCHGDKLLAKLLKLCEGFRASLYTCPSSKSERERFVETIDKRRTELDLIINQTDAYRRKFLVSVANQVDYWTTMERKIKAIYHVQNYMNMDVTGKCLIGECWVAERDLPLLQKTIAEGASVSIAVPPFIDLIKTDEIPPTYNKTNKYTRGFQNLIDVYGMATYREANPALYSIITFPFLFAVMFGDMGHAIVMILFALYLIAIEKKVEQLQIGGEVFSIFFVGRYMILLMGIFSFYTGFIYNDMFSRPVNLFGSQWFIGYNKSTVVKNDDLTLDPSEFYRGTPYNIGVDPIWGLSHNSIIFFNSYKMKVSIILGVFHMILGLSINIINYRFFNETENIYLEFLPRLVLLCSLFLWMVLMMFIKWTTFSADSKNPKYGTACAPSILVNFIDMMLFRTTTQGSFPGCDPYLFKIQPYVQNCLVLLSALTIPVMLFAKPIYTLHERKKHKKLEIQTSITKETEKSPETSEKSKKRVTIKVSAHEQFDENTANRITKEEELAEEKQGEIKEEKITILEDPNEEQHESKIDPDNEKEGFGEVMILQIIDTIEYALGTISHTASYLRLWALSLAHNELSEVLWLRLLTMAFGFQGYMGAIAMFICFGLWMFFTVSILITMEGLSAFLHTLRLHWVEFMSKFYSGTGYPFRPFCFKTILQQEEEEANKPK